MAEDGSPLSKSVSTFIAAALTAVTALAGAIGGLSGALAELIRNQTDAFYAAAALSAIGLVASVIVIAFARYDKTPGAVISVVVSLVAYLSAGYFLVTGSAHAVQASHSPRVAVSWKALTAGQDSLAATISVKLGGLKTNQFLYITVDSVSVDSTIHLYKSVTGTDSDGNADLTFDVPIPPGVTALQIFASADPYQQSQSCGGRSTETPPPAPTAAPTPHSSPSRPAGPAPSSSLPVPGVSAALGVSPHYGCVVLLVPVPVPTASPASTAPSATP